MSVETREKVPAPPEGWITGEEYAREWNRLNAAGLRRSPEMEALLRRVDLRNDWLFEKYGEPLMERHHGKWIAISFYGEHILADSEVEVHDEADRLFGEGNYASARLTASRGARLLSPRTA